MQAQSNSVVQIAITSSKYPQTFALIDSADAGVIAPYRWRVRKDSVTFYAYATPKGPNNKGLILMHRLILGVWDSTIQVDHINHDGLDNRRCNLRLVNNQQNQMNRTPSEGSTSRYKGVHWNRRSRKWRTQIEVNGKQVHLGMFDDEISAAKAYDLAASELFGEYAYLNFPAVPQ